MKAVILAGGMGIRLRPFTFSIPKPLLPVGEKPILEIIIRRLKAFGFDEFILSVGYKSKMVETFFGDGSDFGVNISYLRESKPSGTAGPLALLRRNFKLAKNEYFLLMNGDIMTSLNFSRMREYHRRNNYEITVGVKDIREKKSYGFVEIENGIVKRIVEKPIVKNLVNAGIYFINSSALTQVPANRFFTLPQLINKLIAKNFNIGGYEIREFWLGLEELRHFEEIRDNGRIYNLLTKA